MPQPSGKLKAPVIGATVVYMAKDEGKSWRSEHAAIITGLPGDGFYVHLTVFEHGKQPYFVDNVPTPGTKGAKVAWRWPDKQI